MSTFCSLHFHVTFSTKYRKPSIRTRWRGRLHEYLGGTIRGMDGVAESIGGVEDHVHLLIGLKTTHRIADVMRELKKKSSRWIHEEIGSDLFSWQEGYAVFSVSATARGAVKKYISNQEEHHRKRTFREELRSMLDQAGVEYNSKYLD